MPESPIPEPTSYREQLNVKGMSMTTAVFHVSGMTCGHCVSAVTSELKLIDGVLEVSIDLVPGEVSAVTVESAADLPPEAVRAAVDEAGYELVE